MRYAQVLTLGLVFSIAGAGHAVAQCGISISGMNANINNTGINYVTLQGNITLPFGSLLQAIGVWGFGCSGSGSAYPAMNEGAYDPTPGVVNFYVVYPETRHLRTVVAARPKWCKTRRLARSRGG